jgi:hypothetical protein
MSGQTSRPRSGPWQLAAALAGALGSGWPALTLAQSAPAPDPSVPQVALAWSGPGPELTCLGEEGLARAVNDYLGRDAFAVGRVDLVLAVNLERLPDRTWRAVLELRDPSGTALGARELVSSTELCASLDEPLVLAVALMVDSEAEPAPISPVAEPEPEPEPEPPAAPPPRRAPPAWRWAVDVDASVAVEAGLLPAARPGLELGLELEAASWLSARVSGFAFLPAASELPGNAEVGIWLAGGVLALCPGIRAGRGFRAALCAGPVYGLLVATSRGLDGGGTAGRRFLAGAVGLRGVAPLGARWSGVVELRGLFPYRPDRFTYAHGGVEHQFFRVSSLSALATAGVSIKF